MMCVVICSLHGDGRARWWL